MSSLGVMQPYLFPYLGYYQLIHAVDRFVVYDDVNYIKQGWVNRNRILLNGAPHLFTLPVAKASSFVTIDALRLEAVQFHAWRTKFLRSVGQAYARAPQVKQVLPLLEQALAGAPERLADLLLQSLGAVLEYLGIRTELVRTSTGYGNQALKGQERIIDICRCEGAGRYINAIGGTELYDRQAFARHGLELAFLKPSLRPYPQGRHAFVPGLSIIDALMFLQVAEVQERLDEYQLV